MILTEKHKIRVGHDTELEKEFIDWLGRGLHYDWSKHKKIPSRLELLKKYKSALMKRGKWTNINPVEVRGYLDDAIIKERNNF